MKAELNLVNYVGDTITILEGKALDPKYPVPITFGGDIRSVSAFLDKRHTTDPEVSGNIKSYAGRQYPELHRAIIVVNKPEMEIRLWLDPEDPFGGYINAKLNMNPDLLQFSINQQRMFNREELIKLLRFNRRFFPNKERYLELLTAYQSLKLSTSTEVEQKSDTRGNKKQLFDKNVDSSNLPDSFVLQIPIFSGEAQETFRVEIGLEATDGSIRFWLESTELAELIDERKESIIEEEIQNCQDFVIIHK